MGPSSEISLARCLYFAEKQMRQLDSFLGESTVELAMPLILECLC